MKQLDAIFEIADTVPIQKNLWRVGGRALIDIRVGSMVSVQMQVDKDVVTETFEVVSVSAYGYEISTLYAVMTGYLTLQGEVGNILPVCKYLFEGR